MTETEELKDRYTAYALLRIILGVNILMHGVSRLLAGSSVFVAKITTQFAHTSLPHWSLIAFAMLLPWVEALLGLLLLLGLRTRSALIAGSLLMLVLTFGSSLVQDWGIAGLQLTYAIAYFGLLFLLNYNRYSLDGAFAKRSP
jgi:thiosulfate dehydrogenase [quinone] large subunit